MTPANRGSVSRFARLVYGSVFLVGPFSLFAWSAAPAFAATQAGTSGAQFLKIGAGSRAGGMAEAYAASSEDVYSLYYNPAAATLIHDPELAAAHTAYIQGSNYEFVGFAYPLSSGRYKEYSRHVLGIALYNLGVPDIERRGATDTPDPLGTFDAGDYSYNLSYAWRRDRFLGLGGTAKIIHQTLDTYSSNAFAVDLGAHYAPYPEAKRPFSYAAVLKNFGTRPKFAGSESDPLPLGYTLGVGCQVLPRRLKLELDLSQYRDTDPFVALGGEYQHEFGEGLSGALRAGYSSHRKDNDGLNGIALGLGVNFHRASFDFAWVPFGNVGDTFRYSLVIRFGGGREPYPEAPRAQAQPEAQPQPEAQQPQAAPAPAPAPQPQPSAPAPQQPQNKP